MKYVKANNVLPKEILEIIQEYIDGEYLYIPKKRDNVTAWGEKNGSKNHFKKRNGEIYVKYVSGIKVPCLAKEYFLSEQSIRRIISKEKNICA